MSLNLIDVFKQVLSMSRLGGAGAVAQLVADVPLSAVEVINTNRWNFLFVLDILFIISISLLLLFLSSNELVVQVWTKILYPHLMSPSSFRVHQSNYDMLFKNHSCKVVIVLLVSTWHNIIGGMEKVTLNEDKCLCAFIVTTLLDML